MKHAPTTLAIAAVFTLAASTTMAQGTATTLPGAATATSKDAKLSRADAGFLKDAALAGMAEVESSQLALQKATDPTVKSFAQKMVDDHTKANEELKALAQSKGVELPDEPSLMQKGKLKALSTADGADFDKRYAENMGVEAHADTVKLFQKAAKDAKDPDVKAFAANKLPTLQDHLRMAHALHASTSGAAARGRNDGAAATSGTGSKTPAAATK